MPDQMLRAAMLRSRSVKYEAPKPDPRDLRITQLEERIKELEAQLAEASKLEIVPTRVPQIGNIARTVASFYGFSADEMRSPARGTQLVRARQIAWWLCRVLRTAPDGKQSPYSYTQIGNYYNRDHTTVIHGINLIEATRYQDEVIESDIRTLRAKFVQPDGAN